MIQKVGRLANEQVGPVVDQIRLTYGGDMAHAFQETVKGEMDNVLATLASAKDTLDDVVTDISNGSVPGSVDMDVDFEDDGEGLGDEIDSELGMDGEIGGDDGFEDEFGAEEPLGRAELESKRYDLAKKIIETQEKINKIRQK
jgi:hypothetical protein